jgi:nitrogenase molybdenum-iron protein alpha/beta subunit
MIGMSKGRKWTRESATVFLRTKTRGKKRKDASIVEIAEAAKYLYEKMDRSFKNVGREVGISSEMIREFYEISQLPQEVKTLIEDRKILIDAARRLSRLHDKKRQIEVAEAIAGLTSHDQRAIIEYAITNPRVSARKCRDRTFGSKDVRVDKEELIIPLSSDEFETLGELARKRHMGVADFSKSILIRYLKNSRST